MKKSTNTHTITTGLAAVLCLAASVFSSTTYAGQGVAAKEMAKPVDGKFVNFEFTNLEYLWGFNWQKPFSASHERDIVTIEHFDDNKLGDLYYFIDFANLVTGDRGSTPKTGIDIYAEISPRLSLSKITGMNCKFGFIKDILFYSGTFEIGSSGSLDNVNRAFGTNIESTHLAQLHGMALDFNIPGFAYSGLNAYWRDDLNVRGSTWQITGTWGIPFKIGAASLMFKGFFDYSGKEGPLSRIFHTSPQLVVDIGEHLFHKKDVLLVGTEVDIWINEFGVKGQNDFVPQTLVEVYF